jgi:GAF domain-containing protein
LNWVTALHPAAIPDRFSAAVIRDVAGNGQVFTFVDHAELVSGALFPLKRDAVVLGVLGVVSDQTDYFGPQTVQWIKTLCGLIAESLFQSAGTVHPREVEYSITRILLSSLEVYEVLPAVLQELAQALAADAVTALQSDPPGRRFKLLATYGLDSTALAKLNFHLDASVTGRLMGNSVLWIEDLEEKDRQLQPINPFKEEGFRGYLALPLGRDGNLIGALEFAWRSPHAISWEVDFLKRVSVQITHAMDRADILNRYRNVTAELVSRYNAMIEGLSRALELRDLETEGHTRRVSRLTMRLVEHMDIPADQWDAIRQGALFARHRQDRHPGCDPAQAGQPDWAGKGGDAATCDLRL